MATSIIKTTMRFVECLWLCSGWLLHWSGRGDLSLACHHRITFHVQVGVTWSTANCKTIKTSIDPQLSACKHPCFLRTYGTWIPLSVSNQNTCIYLKYQVYIFSRHSLIACYLTVLFKPSGLFQVCLQTLLLLNFSQYHTMQCTIATWIPQRHQACMCHWSHILFIHGFCFSITELIWHGLHACLYERQHSCTHPLPLGRRCNCLALGIRIQSVSLGQQNNSGGNLN